MRGVEPFGVHGSHYVRSFGVDVLAEFEDGEPLGLVHATMVRPLIESDERGSFENGEFWGLVEFYDDLGDTARVRLVRGDLVNLRSQPDNPVRRLPVPGFVVEPVRDVRGELTRWLVREVRN